MLTLRLTLRLQLLSVFRLYVLARNALRKRNPGNKTSETQVFPNDCFTFVDLEVAMQKPRVGAEAV